jgi:hypothetical protein
LSPGGNPASKALAWKIASFPFIDQVIAVSRSIKDDSDVADADSPKITALAADVSTKDGRTPAIGLSKKWTGFVDREMHARSNCNEFT